MQIWCWDTEVNQIDKDACPKETDSLMERDTQDKNLYKVFIMR